MRNNFLNTIHNGECILCGLCGGEEDERMTPAHAEQESPQDVDEHQEEEKAETKPKGTNTASTLDQLKKTLTEYEGVCAPLNATLQPGDQILIGLELGISLLKKKIDQHTSLLPPGPAEDPDQKAVKEGFKKAMKQVKAMSSVDGERHSAI